MSQTVKAASNTTPHFGLCQQSQDHPYAHARILRSYGSTAGNPTGHLKAMLTGNRCLFPVVGGQLVMGPAQDIYFYEFDGPAKRTITFTVTGE